MIFHCPACCRKLRAKAELVGKSVKCPACGTRLRVGQSASPPMELRRYYERSAN
jgi:hypothetical protein